MRSFCFPPRAAGKKLPSANFFLKDSASVNNLMASAPAAPMRVVDVIRKKRDGQELSHAEIELLVEGYTRGTIPDYQVAAWLMAGVLRGFTRQETVALTELMLHSGEVLDLSEFSPQKVDKHSTGG